MINYESLNSRLLLPHGPSSFSASVSFVRGGRGGRGGETAAADE